MRNKIEDLAIDLGIIVQRLEREGVELSVDDIKTVWKLKTYLGYVNPISIENGTGGLIRKDKVE